MASPYKSISVSDIIEVIGTETCRVIGPLDRLVTHPASVDEAGTSEAFVFAGATQSVVGAAKVNTLEKIRGTKAGVIISSDNLAVAEGDFPDKTLILVANPRLTFIRVLNALFVEHPKWGLHPTVIVDDQAEIDPQVYIGPYCIIGKCRIGQGTIIHGQVMIYDGTQIGRNVQVFAQCTLGAEGFGFERNQEGELEKFPHFGRLIIGDNVEIQAQCNLDRGTLGDTVIGEGTKIDTGCHIGHNTQIGRHCVITAHCMVGAGIHIEDRVWIAPGSTIRNRIRIGEGATIGEAAMVTKDVLPGIVVMGAPARPVDEYKRMLKRLRE